jgi:tRNA (cytidine32/guanosine34-2'-O)-methyltransferase
VEKEACAASWCVLYFVLLTLFSSSPHTSGLHDVDEYLQAQLLLSAMCITTHVLEPGCSFVAKIFRGRNVGILSSQLRLLFERVSIAKPSSSRNSSMEAFVVCQGFKGGEYLNLPLDGVVCDDDLSLVDIPFVACGDLSGFSSQVLDSDKSYPIDSEEYIPPIAPPIQPPYETSIALHKEQKRAT